MNDKRLRAFIISLKVTFKRAWLFIMQSISTVEGGDYMKKRIISYVKKVE